MAGFKSERAAGFKLECIAGFVGIRTPEAIPAYTLTFLTLTASFRLHPSASSRSAQPSPECDPGRRNRSRSNLTGQIGRLAFAVCMWPALCQSMRESWPK
jgi:hypothetical protein